MNRRTFLTAAAGAAFARPAAADDTALVVLAASSLTEALQRAGEAWTALGNPRVTFSFDASSRLAKQIEAGAPADLFFAADRDWMDFLDAKGLIDPATRRNLVGNGLVVITRASSAVPIATVADLAKPELHHVALAGENVPAGKYARAALVSLGVWDGIKERVVSGEFPIAANMGGATEQMWQWQAKGAPLVAVMGSTPVLPSYFQLAVPRNSAHPNLAKLFTGFMASKEAQAILEKQDFRTSHLVEGTMMNRYLKQNKLKLQEAKESINFYLQGEDSGLEFKEELTKMLKQ